MSSQSNYITQSGIIAKSKISMTSKDVFCLHLGDASPECIRRALLHREHRWHRTLNGCIRKVIDIDDITEEDASASAMHQQHWSYIKWEETSMTLRMASRRCLEHLWQHTLSYLSFHLVMWWSDNHHIKRGLKIWGASGTCKHPHLRGCLAQGWLQPWTRMHQPQLLREDSTNASRRIIILG